MSGQDRENTQIEKSKDVSTKVHPFGADSAFRIVFHVWYGGVVMHQQKSTNDPGVLACGEGVG